MCPSRSLFIHLDGQPSGRALVVVVSDFTQEIDKLQIAPTTEGSSITFVRTDLLHACETKASAQDVTDTSRTTTLSLGEGDEFASVKTVEHKLSALYGSGLDDIQVRAGGSEVPAMDRNANPFVRMLPGSCDQRTA